MHLFKLLLLLYPKSFRNEYASEMISDFRARKRQSHPITVWPEVIVDTVWNAAAAHLDILRQDMRWAVRSLSRTPGFTSTAIGVTALGIGATVAVFTLADHVLIRPLPYREPDRLVKVWQSTPNYTRLEASPANYRDWLAMDPPFEQLAAWKGMQVNVAGQGDPRLVAAAGVTANMLPMLGVQPLIGRAFTAEDDKTDAPNTVLLSYGEWRDNYGGDPAVIGRKLLLDGKPAEVIGVMPPWFRFPIQRVKIWTPMRFTPNDFADRTNVFLLVVGRVKPGLSIAQARERMSAITARLEKQYPVENAQVGSLVISFKDEIPQQSRMLLYTLSGAALGVLLIACINLANLLLSRAASRRQELAIRTSLGAGRDRLVRQLITESSLLALAGGIAGALLGLTALPLLAKLVPTMLPLRETPTPDIRVWLICGGLTILTGLGFGLMPALMMSRNTAGGLRDGGRSGMLAGRRERIRGALVIAEISACVVLLAGSGLLLRALWKVQDTELGFRQENRLTLRTSLSMPKYESVARRHAFYTSVLDQLAATPGVHSAAYTSFLPVAMGGGIWQVKVPGEPPEKSITQYASLRFVTPAYFRTMGIPILQGRGPGETDNQNSLKVAVVSQSFVDRYLDGTSSALGRTFEFAFFPRTIVGVVADVQVRGPERRSEPQVYLPDQQIPDGWMPFYAPKDLVVHTDDMPGTIAAVRRIVSSVDPEQPVSAIQSMEELVAAETQGRRTQMYVLGAFAASALLLAGVGIHGLLAFGVSQRRQEIGVRLALGAQTRDILRLVVSEGVVLAAIGLCIGIFAARLLGRAFESLLAGVSPFDPLAFGTAAALCAVTALFGSLGPALRAIRVDPAESIRAD